MKAIKINNLNKIYNKKKAVDNISFSIQIGSIVGVVGANGAGKTTMIEMIVGLRKPTEGNIEILGFNALQYPEKVKEKIGVCLQEQYFYKKAKVKEVLEFFQDLYFNPMKIEEVIKIMNLEKYLNVKVQDLSGGLRQRVMLAIAIIGNPEVLFLDEPTTGLDPEARRELWKSILEFKKESKTIILSSHYMEEVQKYCDEVIIMKNGKIIQKSSPKKLIEKLNDNTATMEDVYIKFAIEEGRE